MTRWGTVVALVASVAFFLGTAGSSLAGHSTRGCANCHLPHKAATPDDPAASWGVPLWNTANTKDGLPTFTLYGSDAFVALGTDITQPDGASKLCLGCHDGSYSGVKATSPYRFATGDFAHTHPISFTYDSSLAARHPKHSLVDPAVAISPMGGTVQQDLLDSHGKVQCVTCHDVHTSGFGAQMLRFNYDTTLHTDNAFCRACHIK